MKIIIIKPHLTESSIAKAKLGKYTFEVAINATKHAIAHTLETMYKVKVDSVKTTTRLGKVKTVGRTRKTKQASDRKFAYISLKSGKIDLFPID